MNSVEQIKTQLQDLCGTAKQDGASLEVSLGRGESFSTGYQSRQLKKFSADQSQVAVFRVLVGKGTGVATTENLSAEALKQTYAEALRSAKDLNRGAGSDKLEPELLQSAPISPLNGLYHSDYSEIPVQDKLKWAAELESVALAEDTRITNVPYSGLSHATSERWLINSRGVDLNSKSSSFSAHSYALARQGDDSKAQGYSYFARDPKEFRAEEIAKEASKRSLALLGAEQPRTGKWNVIFSNEVAAHLVDLMMSHFSAKFLDEGTSLFKGRQGEQVFSEQFNWNDDPFRADLPGARAFDAEGSPSQRTSLIEAGVLKSFLTNSYYSRKLSLPNTAHAARGGGEMDVASTNILVTRGSSTLDDLLKLSNNTMVVTELTAFHSGFKGTTADFSLPGSGFLYRHGERVKPVHQFVLSDNLLQVFGRIAAVSNRWNQDANSTRCPDLFAPDISIAGRSA